MPKQNGDTITNGGCYRPIEGQNVVHTIEERERERKKEKGKFLAQFNLVIH